MPAHEFDEVGSTHPQGFEISPTLLAAIHTRVTNAIDVDIADAVCRFLTNTARTTVRIRDNSDTFVITGDIPAMWLRDSCAQLAPFLRIAPGSPDVQALIAGLLRTHWRMILIDPYANAFNEMPNGNRWDNDHPEPGPWVWERKWEIDSLAYPLDLAGRLLALNNTEWITEETLPAIRSILDVLETELDHERLSPYRFVRDDCPPQDTLVRGGRGRRMAPCGLVWQGFRPSDDACALGFNLPGNIFMASALRAIPQLLHAVEVHGRFMTESTDLAELADRAQKLKQGIVHAVRAMGQCNVRLANGEVVSALAYEINGQGETLFMDDANVPSLLSLPYLDAIDADDPLYVATRTAVLSTANPTYFAGTALQGVGSQHTPDGYVWPIALSVEGLTSRDRKDQTRMLHTLLSSTGGTGYMHEGVDSDDTYQFTRPWFSWSNSMFCELALEVAGFERPAYADAPLL